MAQISVSLLDGLLDRVLDGVCGQYGYKTIILGEGGKEVQNPETKAQFVKKVIASFIKESCCAYESNKDAEGARKVALDKARREIEIS